MNEGLCLILKVSFTIELHMPEVHCPTWGKKNWSRFIGLQQALALSFRILSAQRRRICTLFGLVLGKRGGEGSCWEEFGMSLFGFTGQCSFLGSY